MCMYHLTPLSPKYNIFLFDQGPACGMGSTGALTPYVVTLKQKGVRKLPLVKVFLVHHSFDEGYAVAGGSRPREKWSQLNLNNLPKHLQKDNSDPIRKSTPCSLPAPAVKYSFKLQQQGQEGRVGKEMQMLEAEPMRKLLKRLEQACFKLVRRYRFFTNVKTSAGLGGLAGNR